MLDYLLLFLPVVEEWKGEVAWVGERGGEDTTATTEL